MAPGFRKFEAYEATAGFDDNYDSDPLTYQESTIIEDDECATTYCHPINPWLQGGSSSTLIEVSMEMNKHVHLQPTFQEIPIAESKADEVTPDATLLLQYHRQFGHISFTKLKYMAKMGVIPKMLVKCPTPVCSACM